MIIHPSCDKHKTEIQKREQSMKNAYPIILIWDKNEYYVEIPDFEIGTQGKDLADAIEMARDAIGIMGIDMEDDGEKIPTPSSMASVTVPDGALVSLVDVDFAEYRRRSDMRTVRRNVSLPGWLDEAASEAGINVSAVLQAALKKELQLG